MATLTLRQLTAGQVAFTAWRLNDGSLHRSRVTQSEYEDFAVKNGGVGDAPGRPTPDAQFLMGAGGVPALDTPSGWPDLGDYWFETDPDTGKTTLMLCTGGEEDWSYQSVVASDPGAGTKSRLTGMVCEVRGNRLAVPEGGYTVRGGELNTITRALPAGVSVGASELTVDPAYVTRETTFIDREVLNHKSVTFDAGSSASTGSGTASSLTFSHTVANQSDRYLAMLGSGRGGQEPTAATFNGVSMTERVDEASPGPVRVYIFDLVAPDITTANIVVTYDAATSTVAGGMSAYGVDQSSPRTSLLTPTTGGGPGNHPNFSGFASATDELVFAVTCWEANGGQTCTNDTDWTQVWNLNNTSGNPRSGLGAYMVGAATVSKNDTLSATTEAWNITAVAVNAVSAGGATHPGWLNSRGGWF